MNVTPQCRREGDKDAHSPYETIFGVTTVVQLDLSIDAPWFEDESFESISG